MADKYSEVKYILGVTEPYSRNYGRSYYWAGYVGINNKSTI